MDAANPPRPDGRRLGVAAVVIGLAGAAYAVTYWLHGRGRETTDDAFIDAHVIMVSAKVEGQVLKVLVDDNQQVQRGDLLLEMDPVDFRVKLDQAKADLRAAEADARKAAGDAASARQLFAKDRVSRQVFEHSQAEAEAAAARAELAHKKVDAAELNLTYTRLAAPAAGKVTRKAVELRSYVRVGQPLLAVVTSDVWVTANFKETQLTDMRPGQKAEVRVDAFPGRTFAAHVDSIQAGTGARFSLLPPENATGNYVKVVQRVPVKIVFDEPAESLGLLAPGMSAVPVVDMR